MDANVRDAKVIGYEDLIESLSLPDTNDRHVLAAAIKAGTDAIITTNFKDFPDSELSRHGETVLNFLTTAIIVEFTRIFGHS